MEDQIYQADTIQKKSGAAVLPLGNVMFSTKKEIEKVMT